MQTKGETSASDIDLIYNDKKFENGMVISELKPKIKDGMVFQIVFSDHSSNLEQCLFRIPNILSCFRFSCFQISEKIDE